MRFPLNKAYFINMIAAIIIIVVILIVKIMYDYRLWLKHKPVNHLREWLIMAAFSIPSVILFSNELSIPLFWAYPLSASMCAAFIWFFFNGIYNIIRGYNWWFTGSDGGSFTDKVLKIIGPFAQKVLEIALLFTTIILYIIFLK